MSRFCTYFSAAIFLLSAYFSKAQGTIIYLNHVMEEVCCKDSASFYRIGINDHGVYKDSIRDYYITGELLEEGFYPKWGAMGEFTGYFKNGSKSFTGTLMQNEFNYTNTWDATGLKTMKRGNGLSTLYYPANMNILSQGNYKGGEKNGYWIWNNSAGKKVAEGIYGKGETLTAYNTWDDRGEKQLVVNGTGITVRYYSNGKLKYREEWKDNKREGRYAYYFENGKIRCEGSFKNDKREAAWKWFFDNGVCEEETSYVEGMMHGPVTLRNATGHVIFKGEFKYGNRSGHWEWFTDEGLPQGSFNYN